MHNSLQKRLLSIESRYSSTLLWPYFYIITSLCIFVVHNTAVPNNERNVHGKVTTSSYTQDSHIITIKTHKLQ